MIYLAGFVLFVLALLVSVVLHEGGHFWTARRFGMKATQFFVGFGPTLWSRRRGETEYGIKAVPAGGFVKIVGMTQLEEVAPEDEDRAFWRQPAPQRAVVLAAGSTMHFVIAIVLTFGAVLAIGVPVEASPRIAPSACVADDPLPGAATAAERDCSQPGTQSSPAALAGVQEGDVVLAVDGEPVADSEAFVTRVRALDAAPFTLTVERDGNPLDLQITPVTVERNSLTEEGVRAPASIIGVSVGSRLATERVGPVEAVQETGTQLTAYVEGVVVTLTEKLGTITQLYGEDRDPAGFVGVIGAGRITGEALELQETAGYKALFVISIIAGLNLFVGVFNLLPLLPLDGGHLAVLLYEQARDKLKRLRGYTGELARVDLTKLLPITYVVVLVFGVGTLFIAGADIVNPIRLSDQ